MAAKNPEINMGIVEHVRNPIRKADRCKTIIRIEKDYIFAGGGFYAQITTTIRPAW
jgi:hypothetical protein